MSLALLDRPTSEPRWSCCDCCGTVDNYCLMVDGKRDNHEQPCPHCQVERCPECGK